VYNVIELSWSHGDEPPMITSVGEIVLPPLDMQSDLLLEGDFACIHHHRTKKRVFSTQQRIRFGIGPSSIYGLSCHDGLAYSAPIPPLGSTSKPAPVYSPFSKPNTFPLEPCIPPVPTTISSFSPDALLRSSSPTTTITSSSSFPSYSLSMRSSDSLRPSRPHPFDIAPIFSTQWLPLAYRSGTLVEVKSTSLGELLVFDVSKLGEAFPAAPSVFYKGGAFPQGVLSCASEDILVSMGVKPLEGGLSMLRVRIHGGREGRRRARRAGGGGGGGGDVDCGNFDLNLGDSEGGIEICLAPCLRSGSFIHFRDNIVCVERFI